MQYIEFETHSVPDRNNTFCMFKKYLPLSILMVLNISDGMDQLSHLMPFNVPSSREENFLNI